jgi:hypothetical protein
MTERVRETQAQRRARMRTRLLDAAVESNPAPASTDWKRPST